MTLTKGRIDRQGKVQVFEASFSVWEDGLAGNEDDRSSWKRQFKRQVFTRVIQQLNRLGWTCTVPEDMIEGYSASFARNYRACSKGELKGELSVSGRHLEFNMWQGVNTPTRADHGGKYESDKEKVAPYLLRLEMIRTRNRITRYLCNIFTGYTLDESRYQPVGRMITADYKIHQRQAELGSVDKKVIHDCNRKSADGQMLEQGQRVYYFDRRGRAATGIAHYNINNMWWVKSGRYQLSNECASELYTQAPADLRTKRNERRRRSVLEGKLIAAVDKMNFEKAIIFRDLLFPDKEPLFNVWHQGHGSYHCANFCGYTNSQSKAGKFTAAECAGWHHPPNEIRPI